MAVNQFFIIACQKKKIKKLEEDLAKYKVPPHFNVAKFRKKEYPGEWWLTDFTMHQVEGLIENLYIQNKELREQVKSLLTSEVA